MPHALTLQTETRIDCPNWDSFKPQPIYRNSRHVGWLAPRLTQQQIAASPAIQGWSVPAVETRTS